jgi:hypothetical protein
LPSPAFTFKTDNTVNFGEKGVVFAHSHVLPWMKLGAHLSNQNISRSDKLATKAFDTAPLSRAVPTVS